MHGLLSLLFGLVLSLAGVFLIRNARSLARREYSQQKAVLGFSGRSIFTSPASYKTAALLIGIGWILIGSSLSLSGAWSLWSE